MTTWFSSRGPSPLDAAPHPALAAPGTQVWSTRSGGGYVLGTGTSMATPHVSGAAALLLSVDPGLDNAQVTRLLTSTARQIGSAIPSLVSGWGALDAYAAAAAAGSYGVLDVRLTVDGRPLARTAFTVTTAAGVELPFRSASDGTFTAPLADGAYTVTVRSFGYAPAVAGGLVVSAPQTTAANLALTALPTGRISGTVRDAAQQPVAGARILVPGTPVSTTTSAAGAYALNLPAGDYQLQVRRNGLRLGSAALSVTPGTTLSRSFTLQPAPRILLVDGGRYLFVETWRYYDDALTDAGYVAERWPILDPYQSNPPAETLAAYDIVIWSAPEYSPEIVDFSYGDVLADFVDNGGQLLVSGQDVALYSGAGLPPATWWALQLGGRYLGSATPPYVLTGTVGGPLDGLALTLNEGDSDGNQFSPDAMAPAPNSLAEPLLAYADGRAGGLYSDLCVPGDIAVYGFGLEGVSERADRSALLARTLERFAAPDSGPGGRILGPTVDDFVLPGMAVTISLPIANIYDVLTDTFSLDVTGAIWPATLVSPTLELGPCDQRQVQLRLDVPASAPPAAAQALTVTLRSQLGGGVADVVVLHHRVPAGGVLLVDDDRFYNVEQAYGAALTAVGLPYETWEIGWDNNVRGAPSAPFLSAYETVVWFTGYDFVQPLYIAEREALTAFLAQGGRLFFSSQDFLFYHRQSSLARDYFGVLDYEEPVTPTLLFAGPPLAGLPSPAPLTFGSYQNNGDGLLPRDPRLAALWGDSGYPAGTATAGDAWRAVFWAVPWEALPPDDQADALGRVFGWLGALHDSSWTVDRRAGPWDAATPRVYTLTLRRADSAPAGPVWVTNTLPAALSPVPGTLSGGWVYSAADHALTWQGVVTPGVPLVLRYAALLDEGHPPQTPLVNRVEVRDGSAGARVPYAVSSWPAGPDLSASALAITPTMLPLPGGQVTATLTLRNAADGAAAPVSATWRIPDALRPVTDTLQATSGSAVLENGAIRWSGTLAPGGVAEVTVVLAASTGPLRAWHPLAAYIDDGVTATQLRTAWLLTLPAERALPIVLWSQFSGR